MAIQSNKPNNRVFLLLGVVLAALAFGGVLFALRQSGGGATKTVVVAKASIAAGSPITADQITTAPVPESAAAADAYVDPTVVVGKTINATVSANTQMVPALFAAAALPGPAAAAGPNGQATAPISLSQIVTKGYVAMAIPASGLGNGLAANQMSVGFYIQTGDHIDILVDPNGSTGVRYSFQDVPVLRVGDSGSAASAAVTSYVVEVPRNQAEILTELFLQRGKDCAANPPACPTAIKYVLRPQSEWGKLTATTYAPNYEAAAGPAMPKPQDTTVTPSVLNSLFGH